MALLKGEERILYIKISAVWIPIACLIDNPFSETVEMLPTTTRTNAGWETSVPQGQSFNISFDGIQIYTEGTGADTTKASYDRLKGIKRARTRIEWKIEDSLQNFVDEGWGYITDLSESSPVGDFLTFSGQITGYGEPIFTATTGGALFQDGEGIIFQNATGQLFQ